jgi:LPS-assembly lipoprotein
LIILTSCGFKPLYGPSLNSPSIQHKFDNIYIDNIPDKDGQYLRNALIDRLYKSGRPADAQYVLSVRNLKERIKDLDITKNSDATRAQLRLVADVSLKEKENGTTLLKRKLTSVTSYNILQSQFTTRVSEEYTRQNALDDIAGQIERELALFFNR